MIERVTISDLGVIERAELPVHPQFTVVTGETGAGKTMVVTALGLLLGARAESTAVRHGAARAVIDAEMTVSGEHRAVAIAREAGAWPEAEPEAEAEAGLGEPAGDAQGPAEGRLSAPVPAAAEHELMLGREVSAKGRSRASLNGRSVPVALLSDVGRSLVTVHGQSDQLRLKSATAQRDALDRYAGAAFQERLAEYRRRFAQYREQSAELEEITANERERRLEAEQLQLALEQIDEVEPVPGEDAALKAESLKLENVEGLREAARGAQRAVTGADIAEEVEDAPHAVELVEQALQALAGAQQDDEELQSVAEQLSSASAQLSDAGAQLGLYAAHLDESGPERLAEVHHRRAELDRLIRLYGPDIDAVLAWAQEARARLSTLHSDADRIEELSAGIAEQEEALWSTAADLRDQRREAGERLHTAVSEELAALSMPSARLVVEVNDAEELGADGADTVSMLLAPHAGAQPLPLGKGASGGELSRVMLALEVVLAEYDSAGTFIFDEVDAGVGGKAAVQIGRRLAMLAEHVQVIVVTHLPQVAAFAQQHIRVFKASYPAPEDADGESSAAQESSGFTSSDVTVLEEPERVHELARMLAGQEDSSSARAHAQELLENARS